MKLQLVGPSNTSYSLAAAAQQSLNCYLETIEGAEGKNKYVLRGRPGIRLFKDLTSIDAAAHPVRGIFSGGGRCWVAAGTKFFEIDINGNLVGPKSDIANDNLPVDILANGGQLFVVSAGTSYCTSTALAGVLVTNVLPGLGGNCTRTGSVVDTVSGDSFDVGMVGQLIAVSFANYTVAGWINPTRIVLAGSPAGTDTNVPWISFPVMTARRGAFLDGYYIVSRPDTRQFNISALLDGSTWSGLDFALKEGYPDNILAPWAEPPLLYMAGSETLEIYRNTGNASFPIERVDGGFSRIGLAALWSPASIMGKLHMLAGGSRGQMIAVRMEGATPVRISTHAVEQALSGIAGSAITGYSYVEGGHWFWVLHVFGAGNAWVYDATESQLQGSPQWHERAQWDGAAFQPYLAQFHTFIPEWATGTHIVGDWQSGKLYHLDSGFFDDNTTDIRCVRALSYVYSDNKRIYHHRLDFELETGTAGTPPVVTLDWSDDRGQTWGTGAGVGTFLTLGPGVTGEFTTRYYAVGLGSSRGRIYRITIQGKGKVALIDAVLDAEVGAS